MGKRKDIAGMVSAWKSQATPRVAKRCVTCVQWPDVAEATGHYLRKPMPEITMHQFYDEVLVQQLKYGLRYDTWMNHVRNCCHYRTK